MATGTSAHQCGCSGLVWCKQEGGCRYRIGCQGRNQKQIYYSTKISSPKTAVGNVAIRSAQCVHRIIESRRCLGYAGRMSSTHWIACFCRRVQASRSFICVRVIFCYSKQRVVFVRIVLLLLYTHPYVLQNPCIYIYMCVHMYHCDINTCPPVQRYGRLLLLCSVRVCM